jgi:ABC-type glycerol-3-phosphate transport system substrate-binding protein
LKRLGLLGLGAATFGFPGRLWAAKQPLRFSGWTFEPKVVQENVEYFQKKYDEAITYEVTPWANYHETMETKFFAGESYDILYVADTHRERWYQAGYTRDLEGFPELERLKKMMFPSNLESLQSALDGKVILMPYFAAFTIFMYHEPLIEKAKLSIPTSFEELTEQGIKLKKDGISQHPILPLWSNTSSGITNYLFAHAYAEGEPLFDKENNPTFGDSATFRKIMNQWHEWFAKELIPPDVLTCTSAGCAMKIMQTGRHAYHFNHSYYLKQIADPESQDSQLAGKKAKMALMPGKPGETITFMGYYAMAKNTAFPERVWQFMRFLGADLDGEFYVLKRWAILNGLHNPYRQLYRDPDVVEAYNRWTDISIMEKQHEKSKSRSIEKTVWFAEWEFKARALLQEMIRGNTAVDAGIKQLADLAKKLKAESS